MTDQSYCLDTSGFLDGYQRQYPPGIFQGLWDRIDDLARNDRLLVPEEVIDELSYHDDAAHKWVKARKDMLIVPTDPLVVVKVREILADHPFLVKTGSTRNRADPFVVATASLHAAMVITGEKGGTKKSPKIPSVCDHMDIPHATFLGMVECEGWSFP